MPGPALSPQASCCQGTFRLSPREPTPLPGSTRHGPGARGSREDTGVFRTRVYVKTRSPHMTFTGPSTCHYLWNASSTDGRMRRLTPAAPELPVKELVHPAPPIATAPPHRARPPLSLLPTESPSRLSLIKQGRYKVNQL